MVRITNSVARHKRRKRLMKQAKGFFGDRKNHIRLTKDAVMKALAYGYRDRKQKKRTMRCLWTVRINAAARMQGMSYSKLMHGLQKSEISVNRKILADLAVNDTVAFASLAKEAQKALA